MWYSLAESALKNLSIPSLHPIKANARAKPRSPARSLIAVRFARRSKIWNLIGRMNANRLIWPAPLAIWLAKETPCKAITYVNNSTRNKSKLFLSKTKSWRRKFLNSSKSSKPWKRTNSQINPNQCHLPVVSNLKNQRTDQKPPTSNSFPRRWHKRI